MTDEQIKDLRDELAAASPGVWSTAFVSLPTPGVAALLDKLDQLTAENARLHLAVPRIIHLADSEADRAFDAMQPSLGTPVPTERRIRRQADRDAAFRRGAEAMRRAVLKVSESRANLPVKDGVEAAWCRSAQCIVDDVRVLTVKDEP